MKFYWDNCPNLLTIILDWFLLFKWLNYLDTLIGYHMSFPEESHVLLTISKTLCVSSHPISSLPHCDLATNYNNCIRLDYVS